MEKADFQSTYNELLNLLEKLKKKKADGENPLCFYDPPPFFHWSKKQNEMYNKKLSELYEF